MELISDVNVSSFFISPFTLHNSVNHLIKLVFNLLLKIRLNLIDLGKLGKGPASVAAKVVYTRHPVGLHSGLLLFGILTPVALDLNNQVQQVVIAVTVIH